MPGPVPGSTRARLEAAPPRVTWICQHLTAGTPLGVLADATGLAPAAFARYGVHLAPVLQTGSGRCSAAPH